MDERYVTMELHNEYAKRMQEEHERQNTRLDKLEEAVEDNKELVISVEKLAMSVHSMVEEQKKQGERLETLEKRDGEMWRKIVTHAITTIVGLVLGFLLRQLGL